MDKPDCFDSKGGTPISAYFLIASKLRLRTGKTTHELKNLNRYLPT
jgi:hypothetical protein